MEALENFWYAYSVTIAFCLVNSFFALSMYAVLSAGILSFTTIVFAAVGGFSAAQLIALTGSPIWLAFLVAGLAGALASALLAGFFLRLETHWMALASLALVLITRVTVLNTPTLTGGVNGLLVPMRVSVLELLVWLALAALVFYRLHHSWYGLATRAVREDPAAAGTMGISVRRIQLIAFLISGAVGGIGGAGMATTLQYISADTFFLGAAFTMIASTVLGGSFHWMGPIVGAFIFTALPTTMQAIVPAIQDVAKGVVLLVIMIYLPRGLVDPRARKLRRAARDREASRSTPLTKKEAAE
ncbi:branched-chain amino acid ABC transporter permease [Pseudooceanicola sp. C21-150M6]|uniref:branched-chain amino acid ABC transporter permease n=1 Tax=Pseudooceanicola sp. C21-150M6 TaxID=3434355 RepID=UPI003D7F1B25